MSYLLLKSNHNYDVGLNVITSGNNLCVAVHCAYYSCIQLMIHILISFSGKSENDIFEAARNDGSSHRYYIREVTGMLEKRNKEAILQYKKIEDLKDFRVRSDYKNIPISKEDSDKAINLAQSIRELLKKTFKVTE